MEVYHEAGRAFVWGDVQLIIIPETAGDWLWGIYLKSDTLTATWSEREWLGRPGWIPLLLIIPEIDSISLDEDKLTFLGEGSAEHGCAPTTLLSFSFSSDENGSISVLVHIDGVPYLALPPEGTGYVDGVVVDLDVLERAVFRDVSSAVFETSFSDTITVAYTPPIPWFELAAHDQVVEVDIDHSCEKSTPTTFSIELGLTFSTEPSAQ